jgi:hypothetical protein
MGNGETPDTRACGQYTVRTALQGTGRSVQLSTCVILRTHELTRLPPSASLISNANARAIRPVRAHDQSSSMPVHT